MFEFTGNLFPDKTAMVELGFYLAPKIYNAESGKGFFIFSEVPIPVCWF